ncbi:FAD-binding oxidoreductase [Actinoplanes aureus]|jgi:FAD/FMN-containing dehydrogenase|uniref:FAD-binding oxidoreductase n=1 Tax=Actinoplanes aureus TaxID=2792083 RepID=A0A931CAC3_9ACTN|nr:FAD-binding oxidoreductase [Actinoplanes aureus]MBG0563766.1 FAD-binding oxidoreductase [Actinoplanes aureus]
MSATSAATDAAAVRLLRQRLGERLIVDGDEAFATARRVWNADVHRRPAAIARCADSREVSIAVNVARDAGMPVSVRAGGHDWAGRALRDGGVVIDLTRMRGVRIDAAGRTVSVQGGATAADLLTVTTPRDLVTTTGVVSSVGMAGLTTVGGYGGLIGRYGLALDNLLEADVVLADGTHVTAGPDDDGELWWALRGGGGNFGVVTRLRYRLHELPVVLAGMLIFPFGEAAAVLAGYADVVADAPDELTVMCGFLPGPDGGAMPFLCPFWSSADAAAGERAMARLRSLGHPIVDQVGPMPYLASLAMFDGNISDRNHYLLGSRWFPEVSPVVAEALIAGAAALPSPYSALIINRFHGAAARVDPAATAFAMRTPHQVAEVIAVWQPGEPSQAHRAWVDSVVTALDPTALPGGYPNLLGPGENERARTSYGANLDRLLAAKRRYDPGNVFASAVPALLD